MNGVTTAGAQILEPYMSAGYELFTWNNAAITQHIHNFIDNLTII
jgi:hypothetical protein